MNAVPLFSAEIELKEDEVIGTSIECSEKHAQFIIQHLTNSGFQCSNPTVVIPGTQRISNWIQIIVSGGNFNRMHSAITKSLNDANVTTLEEDFSLPGDRHVRINLSNISVFDK